MSLQYGHRAVAVTRGARALCIRYHGYYLSDRRGDTDKWRNVDRQASPLGNPLIAASLHWLDCDIVAENAAGDHLIVIGEVKALDSQEAAATQPFLYFKEAVP